MKKLFLAVVIALGMVNAALAAEALPEIVGVHDFGSDGTIICTDDTVCERLFGSDNCTDEGCLGVLAENALEQTRKADSSYIVRVNRLPDAICFQYHQPVTDELAGTQCALVSTVKPGRGTEAMEAPTPLSSKIGAFSSVPFTMDNCTHTSYTTSCGVTVYYVK